MLHFASERPISEAPLTNIATKTVPSDIRANNTMAVFNLLFPATHMSRVELRRHIGLSRMAISKVTEEMTDHRIIRIALAAANVRQSSPSTRHTGVSSPSI